MEQENQKQNQTSADTASKQNTNTANAGGSNKTFDQLMADSPLLSPLAGWLKCLRKPALSMEYSLQKRHVPDLDTDGGQESASASGNQPTKPGQNSDTMGVNGSFTIRYFDFALGIVGLAVVSCMMKGCCCLKRKIF